MRLGNIYWLKIQSEYSHPHVVIEINDDDVTICSITTNMKKVSMPGNVVLDIGECNLQKKSIVEVSKKFKVSKSELKEYIGTLNKDRVEQIKKGVGLVERSFFGDK